MSFFAELKRRNVVRVGLAYIVIGWLLAQVAEFAFENFGAPEWVLKTFVVMLLLGLPLVLFFAWAFELTPEGVKREKDVDRSQSITPQTGQKLNRLTFTVMALAIAYFALDKFVISNAPEAQPEAAATQVSADPQKSIAVLPFVDMSPGKDQEYFTDGLTENLLNALGPGERVEGGRAYFFVRVQEPQRRPAQHRRATASGARARGQRAEKRRADSHHGTAD